MIVTLCLNPTLQKTLLFKRFDRGAVNRAVLQRTDASGKGVNVSRVLVQLGSRVLHITQLGGRNRGLFTDLLLEDGIPLRCVPAPSEIRGCYTVLEQNPFCVTELVEEGEQVDDETETGVRQAFLDAVDDPHARGVVISGSKAKGFSERLFPELAFSALERGLWLIADYRGVDLLATLENCRNLARKKLLIKPNFEEFCETFFAGIKCASVTQEQLCAKMRELYKTFGCASIVTRGDKPVTAYDGKRFYTQDICSTDKNLTIRNTIGCGDAFTAGFIAKITAGSSFEEALVQANRCGALNAASLKPGSILPD